MRIEEKIGALLVAAARTVAVAESCTGGLIGHRLTSVSGSSTYFLGGIIAYSNASKTRDLNVDARTLKAHGAVSEAVARRMAVGVRRRFDADIGIGITGIAGPRGGSPAKPVGRVYISLACESGDKVQEYTFRGDRGTIRRAGSRAALGMLLEHLAETTDQRRTPWPKRRQRMTKSTRPT